MWKPPPDQRVRHELPRLAVPSAAEVARSMMSSPLTLASGLVLADRTWVPAMVPWRATDDGEVTGDVVDWYRRFAEGQPGVIVIEATGIRDVASGPLLRIGDDRYLPGLERLVRAVGEASGGRTRLFVQIIDFLRIRRRPEPAKYFASFLQIDAGHRRRLAEHLHRPELEAASDAQTRGVLATLDDEGIDAVLTARERASLRMGERELVTDVDLPHVRDLPATLPPLFAAAAERAARVGFDGVELHFAHAYTMASFLSAHNTRSDGYGVTRDGRVRLPLEVLRAVRAECPRGASIGARILCDEAIEGGSGVEDACHFGAALAAEGLDVLSLSTGGKYEDAKQPKVGDAAYPYTGKSGFECMPTALGDARGPFGRNVAKQARVRAAIRAAGHATPTVAAGGIASFAQMEEILQSGQADLVGAARQTLADPDWLSKIRRGRGQDIRRCTFSNYCEALDQRHKQVTCQLWDHLPTNDGARRASDGKRWLIAPRWDDHST